MKLGRPDGDPYAGFPSIACASMTRPRTCLVNPADTRWYHCISRCVRRAFLCGVDRASDRNFEHRRAWVTDRLMELNELFAIDLAAYAVMNNHYHLVVHLAPERAASWSDDDVLRRWNRLFTGPPLVTRYLAGQQPALDQAELALMKEFASVFRQRLQSLSWYVRLLNESISRRANEEDNCSGRFWEGRFKSQALLDEAAVLSAMIYVDLNPVRAGMVDTLDASVHTSIHTRLQSIRESPSENFLMPFDETRRKASAIPFGLDDYISLAEWTGRQQRPDKRGAIAQTSPPILKRLGLSQEIFFSMSGQMLKKFGSAIGLPGSMIDHCARRELKYLRGVATVQSSDVDRTKY